MKMTLYEYVADILNDMDGDEVNSIDDTVESGQVAQIVKSSYLALMSNRNWPHMRKSLQLEPSGDPDKPTHMSIKDSVKELCFINYNNVKDGETKKRYEPLKWLEPEEFLRMTNRRDNDKDYIEVVQDYTGVELLIANNKKPEYFTSFDDTHLIFDSYNSDVDTTVQKSKIQAQAYIFPEWEHNDEFIPDLPEEAVTALLEEAKSRCMFKLKQMQDLKSEQEAARQQRWLSRKAWRVSGGVRYPNYGRKGRKMGRDATFKQDR